MNTLSYGLLGILANESMSGYDLMLRMSLFRPTRHSHIYPVLSKLEEDEYVEFILIEQSGKPDKKVYTPTEKGIKAIKEWLQDTTPDPINKDEMLLKTYCLHILDKDKVKKLLEDREEMYRNKFLTYQKKIQDFKEQCGGVLSNTDSGYFGRFVILNKVLGDAKWGMEWCQWVYKLYTSGNIINIFEEKPFDYNDLF
jgi:DNA-binding PadR family transcriptional regulator